MVTGFSVEIRNSRGEKTLLLFFTASVGDGHGETIKRKAAFEAAFQTINKAHVLKVKTWAFNMQLKIEIKTKALASLFIF